MEAITDPSVKEVTVMASTQLLKALDVNTEIPTTRGFVKVIDLKKGDTLFDEQGNRCNLVGKSDVEVNKAAEVHFSDGSSVVCDYGHRWTVLDYTSRKPEQVTLTTEEMVGNLKMHQNRNRYSVPLAKPVPYEEKPLLIDPYVLGVWLADGHKYSANVCLNREDSYCVRERFERAGYSVVVKLEEQNKIEGKICYEGNTIFPMLRALGVISTAANKKPRIIPTEYLHASAEQRLSLLQGILDGDGTIAKNRCTITMKYKCFADQVAELVCSLGMKATSKPHKVLYDGEYRTYWSISFTTYPDENAFSLPRKKAEQLVNTRRSETSQRRIVKIEDVEARPVQCLMVDSPSHLFLCTRNYIPTHNTELVLNVVGYFVHQDPSPILVVQPTVDLAETWSKDRLDPMLRDSPALRGIVAEKKRDSGNKILHKQFSGGHITMVGANSPSSLAMRPIRIVLFDETDKYPMSAGKEGDPIMLATERTATFWNRKSVKVCSPTIEGTSRIEQSYLESDQRVFEVPCHKCGARQEMQWEQVKWTLGKPETARYHCLQCDTPWEERDRLRAIQQGEYRATAPFNGHAGFRVSKLVSPWEPITVLAEKYEKAKDKPEQLKTFINTQLARTYKELAEVPDWKALYNRRETYSTNVLPEGTVFVTAGVDIQQDRAEVEIVAWGLNKVSWSIDYRVISGGPQDESMWAKVKELCYESFEMEGTSLRRGIDKIGVDSGYASQDVYYFTSRMDKKKVICTKGSDTYDAVIAAPSPVDLKRNGKVKKRGHSIRKIGSSYLKLELYGWLKQQPAQEGELDAYGYCHFPQYGDDYFKMLTAEELQNKIVNGYVKRVWHKTRERNEALDCRAIARAMASVCGIDRMKDVQLKQAANTVGVVSQAKSAPAPKDTSAAPEKSDTNKQNQSAQTIQRRESSFF